ncbi:MAG: PEP-CTERM sorting domain-containing protein [Roseibacillus sp.]
MKHPLLTRVLPIVSFIAISSLQAQDVILFDDMTTSAYVSSSTNGSSTGSNPIDISFAYNLVETSGGNPDSVMNAHHYHDVQRDEFGFPVGPSFTNLESLYSNSSLSYNPAAEGPIQSITFSLDIKTTQPFDLVYFTINDSSGSTVADGKNGEITVVSDGEWHSITLSEVTQAGATDRDFAGSDSLFFGFGFTSFAEVTNGPANFLMSADNFQINITPVPEPSSLLLLTLGLLGLTGRRR